MGWIFRRSIRFGPIRMNMSKGGVGWSWGFPGFRVGISSDGRRYYSFGFPGTGLYYRKYLSNTIQQHNSTMSNPIASKKPTTPLTVATLAKGNQWWRSKNP